MVNLDDFKAWLSNQGGKKVGLQSSQTDSPLIRFLATTSKSRFKEDGRDIYRVNPQTGQFEHFEALALWSRLFVAEFDSYQPDTEPQQLTGTRALRILEDALQQIADAKLDPNSTTAMFPMQ